MGLIPPPHGWFRVAVRRLVDGPFQLVIRPSILYYVTSRINPTLVVKVICNGPALVVAQFG
jgi:hypothetical protein